MDEQTKDELEQTLNLFDAEMHEVVPKIQHAVADNSPEVIVAACAFIAGSMGIMFNMERERFLRHVYAMVSQGLDIQLDVREKRIRTHQATTTIQ